MATKYFKAEVSLTRKMTFNVAAESEDVAREKAKLFALNENQDHTVLWVELTYVGETEFKIGDKVKHFIFGTGEIIDILMSRNYKNEIFNTGKIKFENGDVKTIGLDLPKEKLEVIM